VKPLFIKTASSILIAFASSASGAGERVSAAPKNLQWRSTECQLEQDNQVIAIRDCKVAFSSDARMYAVKTYDENLGQTLYFQIGLPGASSRHPDCLLISYTSGEEQSYCTVKTAWELGIKGAPKTFSQRPSTGSSGSSCPLVWSDRYRAYEDCKARLRRIYRGNLPFRVEIDTCGGMPLDVYKPCR
jgi:hypothetical protein